MAKLVVRKTKKREKNKLSSRNLARSGGRDWHINKLLTQSLPCAEETGVEHLVGNERRFCDSLISSDLTLESPSQQDQLKKQMWRHRSQSCVRYKL